MTGKIYQGNSRLWEKKFNKELTIHLYTGGIEEKTTFKYVDYPDDNKEKRMELSHLKDKIVFNSDELSTESVLVLKYQEKPKKVLLNNRSIDFTYNLKDKKVVVEIPKNRPINMIYTF